jgi:UDP-N-acetylglucosamine 2-epimerase (non-hydrolysing)
MPFKLVFIAGARPNFMKIAPLMDALNDRPDWESVLIHTGQHYDDSMSGQFFRDLEIASPRYNLEVGSASHAQQTGELMKRLEPVLLSEQPGAIVVVGDVNSTMAGALVASKLGISVVHVEAGLRSFDRTMPEEINRVVTDAISDVLLVTEESGRENLLREGVYPDRIHLVGNLMIDSLQHHLTRARQSDIRRQLEIPDGPFGVLTLHRPANVDDERQLAEILGAVEIMAEEFPLYWPVHPRTAARLRSGNRPWAPGIHLVEPLGYIAFLGLQAESSLVITDSGGIQEETTALGIRCLTLRDNTERPATIKYGTNRLAGTNKETILKAWRQALAEPNHGGLPPLWDGHAAGRCVEVLAKVFL